MSEETLELLRTRLKDPSLNISEMSRKTGISRVSICNIRDGKHNPTKNTCLKLLEYFDTLINPYEAYPDLDGAVKYIQTKLLGDNNSGMFVITRTSAFQLSMQKIFLKD